MEKLTPGVYRHFKGNLYRVWGVVRHSETQEPLVLYQALYGERALWVRPLPMFTEEVEREGKRMSRFQLESAAEGTDAGGLIEALQKSFAGFD